MAGIENREIGIKVKVDSDQAEHASKRLGGSFLELNAALDLASKGASFAVKSFQAIAAAVDRGQAVTELSASFRALGGTAENLETLRKSTQGLVGDMDLMRAANQAALSGLDPDVFLKVAEAADTLGDAVGVNTKEALDSLTAALSTGNERLLKQFGILVDNKKAEEDFARSIGLTADVLNESGKREAQRIAILEEMGRKTSELGGSGGSVETLGDAFTKAGNKISNAFDAVAQWVNESPKIASAINEITNTISNAFKDVGNVYTAFASEGEKKIRAQIDLYKGAIENLQNPAWYDKFASAIVPGISDAVPKKIENYKQKLKELENQLAVFPKTEIVTQKQTKGVEDLAKKFTDTSAAIKKSEEAARKFREEQDRVAKEALKQLKADAEDLLDLYETTLENLPIVGSKGKTDVTELNNAFEDSVFYFADLLGDAFDAAGGNFEEIFKRAAKEVAIGFGAQLIAQWAQAQGLIEAGKSVSGSPFDFGRSIAQGSVTSYIGNSIFGSLFGGGAAAAGAGGGIASAGVPAITAASGLPIVGSSIAEIGAAGGITAAGAGAAGAGAAGAAGAGAGAAATGILGGAAAAVPWVAAAGIAYLIIKESGIFGPGAKAQERKDREELIKNLFKGDTTFSGVGGQLTVDPRKFNATQAFGGQAVGLVNPLAAILTGGNDKLQSDLAGMFENAVAQVDNFNEALVNTQALMAKLGLSAEQAKGQLTQLFLDGKVSFDEFQAGISNLNLLAQENLVGTGSVSDAIKILTENLDTPRTAIAALGLAFNEFKELGITSASDMVAYLMDKFGPEVAAAFQKITAAGIDTFEEVKNASTDQILLIAQAFNLIPRAAQEATKQAGAAINENVTKAAQDAEKKISSLRMGLAELNKQKSTDRGTDNNAQNNNKAA